MIPLSSFNLSLHDSGIGKDLACSDKGNAE